MGGQVARKVEKLVAILDVTAALWVRIQTNVAEKSIFARHLKRSGLNKTFYDYLPVNAF
jgi:hypothetical protein